MSNYSFLLLILVLGCNTSKNIRKDNSYKKEHILKLVIDKSFNFNDAVKKDFRVASASVSGDILSVEVNYKGGCEQHEIKLISRNEYAKSHPPILPLYLHQNDKGDTCRQLINQTIRFNIEEARFPGAKSIKLKISNLAEYVIYNY